MVYDLPGWVHLPLLVLFWVPTQTTVIMLLLWMTGVVGEGWECGCISPACLPAARSLW